MRRRGPSELDRGVGERVRTLREQRGGTVHALARKAFTHHGHMKKIELGLASAGTDTLESVGAALGVRATDLLNTRQSDQELVYELLRAHPGLVKVAREKLASR